MAGVGDVPKNCDRCGEVTLHRKDETGGLHCMACLVRKGFVPATASPPAPVAAPPQVVHVHHKAKGDGVVMGTIKLAGFIVSVMVLLALGTCVYVCGSVGSDKGQKTHAPADRPERPPEPEKPPSW